MELTFQWQQIKTRGRGLTFDDVLIVPSMSEVRSRRNPDLKTQLTKKISLQTPIISANMDTVTETDMAAAMHEMGGIGILHRFVDIEQQCKMVKSLVAKNHKTISASIGVGEDYQTRASKLIDSGVNLVTVDIAHGHSVSMIEVIRWMKQKFQHIEIIGGNIATAQAAKDLIEAGADALKVGIGPGSMCTTRIITGCGVPQLTAIALCSEIGLKYNVPIIADGGLRTSGDVMKALAAGASCVMLGSMLAGTLESPGEIQDGKKLYRGMASKSAQESWRGGVPEGMAAEGEMTKTAIKGRVKDVIDQVTGGIRSGMSYINATQIVEIPQKAHFIEMSLAGMNESRAHGLS